MGFFDFFKREERAEEVVSSGGGDELIRALLSNNNVTREMALEIPEIAGTIDLIAGIIAESDEEFEKFDIIFEIVEVLNELAREDAINCSCGSNKICINLIEDNIELLCQECGIHSKLPANVDTLDMLEEIDFFTLK